MDREMMVSAEWEGTAEGDGVRVRFEVAFEYSVLFEDGVFCNGGQVLRRVMRPGVGGHGAGRAKVMVVVDGGAGGCGAREGRREGIREKIEAFFGSPAGEGFDRVGEVLEVAGGEAAKTSTAVFDQVVEGLYHNRLDRHSYVMVVGGGAVLDAVGYAAGVVHRGMRVVRVPTTVLAQCDGGVGVKTAIDYRGSKNFLGTFSPPWAVVNDFTLLEGLPEGAWRDGTAEAVKVGLVKDGAFFEWIEAHASDLATREEGAMRRLIRRCAEIHLQHIALGGDPFERGSARPLDFGHWAAHKLEQLSGFSLSHGHAVAVGIAIDTLYAARRGMIDETLARRVGECLKGLGFELRVGERCGLGNGEMVPLLRGLEEFREHLGGELTITLPTGVGRGVEVHEVDSTAMGSCARQVLIGG